MIDRANSKIMELTDAELETVIGGNWLGDAFRAIGSAIKSAAEFIISGFQSGPTVNWPSPTNPPRQPGHPY
jgi:hypothetical protein